MDGRGDFSIPPVIPNCPDILPGPFSPAGTVGGWCALVEDDLLSTGGNYGNDTTVSTRETQQVLGNASLLNVSRGPSDLLERVFLKFNLTKLPRNATLFTPTGLHPSGTSTALGSTVFIRLYVNSVTGDNGRQVFRLSEANASWDDWRTTWENQPRAGMQVGTIGPICPTQHLPSTTPQPVTGTNCFRQLELDVSSTLQTWLDHPEGFFGWIVSDAAEGQEASLTTTTTLYSTNDVDRNHHPKLLVSIDKNEPAFSDLRFDGRIQGFTNGPSPVNMTFTAYDPRGQLRDVRFIVRNETGQLFLNESVFFNRTGSVFFRSGGFDLPPGRYFVNVTAVDTDRNWNVTTWASDWNLTVELNKPVLRLLNLSSDLAPLGARLNVSINLTDDSGVRSGRLLLVLQNGTVVGNLTMLAAAPDEFGNATYFLERAYDVPGYYTATIFATDLAGNVNATAAFNFSVLDSVAPVILASGVESPEDALGPFQEAGGNATFTASVADDSLQFVNLSLVGPGANVSVHEMARLGPAFAKTLRLSEVGNYTFNVEAVDAFGLATFSANKTFRIVDATIPAISGLEPIAGAFAKATPRIAATFTDPNIDADTVVMRVGANLDEPSRVPASVVATGAGVVSVVFNEGRYFNGDRLIVEVSASDTLGRAASATWSFTVDDQAPRTLLEFDRRTRMPDGRFVLKPAANLTIDALDDESGVAFTHVTILGPAGSAAASFAYSGPFSFESHAPALSEGAYVVRYGSTDRTGNVEPPRAQELVIDGSAPTILHFPRGSRVRADIADGASGVSDARVFYRLVGGSYLQEALALEPKSDSNYSVDLPSYPMGVEVQYYIQALDFAGNRRLYGGPEDPASYVEPNHAPVITLVAPQAESVLSGSARIAWTVEDADSQRISVDVSLRPVVVVGGFFIARGLDGSGEMIYDTAGQPDGVYELRAQASDTLASAVAGINVRLNNTGLKLSRHNLSAAAPRLDETVKVSTTLYFPSRSVEAVVYRNGVLVQRVALRDDHTGGDATAEDGVFTGLFRPASDGDYRVDIVATFADGSEETAAEAVAFSVKTPLVEQVSRNLGLIIGAVVGLGIASFLVFALLRYSGRI